MTSAPIALGLVIGPSLIGSPAQCSGPAYGPTGLAVPSGCALNVRVMPLDMMAMPTIDATDNNLVGLGSSCPANTACVIGGEPRQMQIDGAEFNVTVAGAPGETFCFSLRMGELGSTFVTGLVSGCPAGTEAPSALTCDTCHTCPDGMGGQGVSV
jgi:hypothetical protein